jgi:tetratricopeptide (TPR) repeat protein
MNLFNGLNIENIVGKLNFSKWFNNIHLSFVLKNQKTNIKQEIKNAIILNGKSFEEGLKVFEKSEQPIALINQSGLLLPSSSSDYVYLDKEEKDREKINEHIYEAVALLNLEKFDEARTELLTILGKVKNKEIFNKEQARTYNNLGVTYNLPKPSGDYDRAIEYFNSAIEKDDSFVSPKAKMNLASAYLNKNTEDRKSVV